MSMSEHLRLVERRNENRSVPVRPANAELRTREYCNNAYLARLGPAPHDPVVEANALRWA
jgi:hypothetical protein